jgi:hypothetical protein
LWQKFFAADDPPPFMMVETWNDHEEGTAIEDGIPNCGSGAQQIPLVPLSANPRGITGKQ